MEKQQIVLGNRDSGTVSGAAPAFFVILKQQQGNGKADQGILVANRDACTLTSSVPTPVKSKVKTCLPADCTSGSITVTLDNNSMWNEFYHRSTEMILTKQGRRMFPYCRYWITGLDSNLKYILVMDISPVDNHRYKWNGRWWEPSGKAEPHVLGRVFIHPESPSTGQYWMHQPVSFYKLKLTNNTLDQEGHIILHSMHRYLPRLHLVPADKATEVIQLNGPDVHTFTFPQTEFFAVTAYQNIQITQLKIDYNPFAKGFRDDGLNSRPQRDLKQNSSSEHEGGSVSSSPSNRGRHTETDGLESQQRDLDSSFSGQNPSDIDLEKESFNAERDFLDFLDADLPLSDMPRLKQEVSESPIASSYESSSRVASPLDPNGHFNVVIKEEPVDDYDYGSSVCIEGITVKQEDTDEETDEYSNSDNDPILEKQLRKRSEMDRKDAGIRSTKRMLANPSGVAKAKMLKLDSGKMPVVYLEPCAVTKSTVKISELPQTMLSSCKKDKSPVSAILDSLPICFENHKDSCLHTVMETEEVAVKKQYSGNKVPQKYCSIKEAPWAISKSSSFKLGSSTGGLFSAKDVAGRKKAGVLRNPMSQKGTGTNQNPMSSGPCRRGRPRKLKISKAGRPPKNIGKNAVTSKNASLGSGSILPDVKPDLEDVDGVLFVSFASKEALDIHTVDRVGGEESQNLQTSLLATSDPGCRARICLLEKELLEDLKSLRHKQVIHPSLQEVGLKLNSVDPTMSIDLKYLGVQLPLSYSKNYSLWNYPRINPGCSDAGFPFVSRTGKTNDFTKIKGWRGKFHGASRNEGSGSEGSLKNRSAFCSDKLDEYLENEGKLMETSMGFSSSTSTSPVVYQLPTKSTSYVRTLDSVLKKQSTSTPSTSYTFKPLAVSSASRKMKTQNKQTASKSRVKPSYKPILPSPVVLKQKHNFSVPGEKVTKSLPSSNMANQVDNFMVPALDENMLPKQISLRQAHQQQQATRPPGLSKSQVKLMDLEDCALWDGKPRTYITEERADISLATLLTAQASLKNKPIHKIIRRRAPPCNNDFCRLGCVCASLALEKRQPTHCRRPDCMFGCTCLKRRVLVVKGGSKHKKILKKAVRGSLVFYGPQGEEQQEEEELEEEGDGEEDELKQKDRRRRKKVEYTICDTEPEQPIRNCPLWIKVEGEIDPEPIYIPTPSVIEPMKPLVLPTPELLPSSKNKSSNGVKPGRVYTPKPNPVIRDEDKDPVYLYFERMMTCARVRAYECKREEKKQQKDLYICNSNNCIGKEHDPEHQTLKKELCEMEKDTDKSGEDGSSQTTTASPQGLSSGTEKRVGPRLLLIPVHQGSPALRPLHNVQLAQGHRMILQPLRSPGGVNLFRHPNGQIIQLVPLHQLRAGGTPSNIQPVMFRNPGSVVGIRLPGPSKPPETPVSPTSSSISIPSVSPVKNSAVQTVGSKSAPTANLVTQASSILPSVPSFVSQAGTLTLRISPPGASSIAGQTGSESKITCSSGGQPTNAASLIPLQSGSFALLQLPGQKSVPNSILHHVASLQIKKDSQNVSQKDESSPTKQQEPEKASHSEDVEVMESEVTVSDSKQEENELPANQSNSTDESAADVIISDRNSTVSEMAEKDPEMLEDYSDDIPTFQHDVSADVISSDHSYISEKPIGEKNKVITEKKRDSVHSEEVLEEVSDNSETISELLGQAVVAPENTVYPESPREQEETAMLKSHVEEYTTTVQAESPDTEQEGNAEPQKKGEEKGNGAQSQSPQEKQEIYAQLESKDKQQEGIQPLQNQKELQDSSAQPEVKRKECEDSVETENIMEERENKSEIIYTKEHDNNSGEMPVESTDECKRNLDIQEKLNSPNQEQGTTGFQKASENAKDNSIHVNSSWNTISSKATDSDNKSNTERENKVEKSVKGYFLTPEQRSQEPKRHKKGYTPTVDITTDDVEEEEEEDDDEKTDDSADEMLDGASDFQSEEEVDVEKLPRVSHSSVPDGLYLLSEDTIGGSALLNDCEYSENDEPVDIETVEELSEKINIARLKATASSIGSSKQKHRIHNPSDEKVADKSTKKPQFWNRKQKNEAEAFAHYRQTHTANERRRRNEMRDLFEKLKRALGLHSLPKVSKCYILKQAYEEIQGLTDQADKLIGQKNLLTRKQDILIRKVSTLSGKTEEVVLKKLEYIYAKQKAVEAQKKRKQVEPEELVVSTKPSRQQEESSTSSKELEQMIVTNRRGKPLILARKGGQAAVETTSSPITLTTAGLVMTPQGQMLTLKSPLMPGQVATVPSTLLQAELKPQVASNTVTTQPGIASVMIQLPGSTVPVQVKGILTNSAIPITLSTIASNPVPPAVGTAAEPASESEDSFMMPKIVNVTSLAAEGGVNLNLNRNKNSHVTPGAGAQTSEPSLKAGPHESRRNEDILSEDKNKASPGDSCGDGRSATGPTQIFLENKDSSFPQIRNVPSVKDSSESFAKKSCIGEFLGSQGRRKETDQGGERLKPKDSPFRKLQVKDLKDSRIEMELRKVASAIEEAELDPSELLGSIEENDDTDETLTSLLNEIAFLNQQLNDDTSGMSELPSTLSSDFSPEDSETRRGTASELTTAAGASFQFGHLGSSFKGLSEVRESSGSISPLLLHLEDDDLTDGERNSAEPSSQADILKIVIGSEMKDPLANLSVTGGGSGKTLDPLAEINVSPPILQMKTNLEAGNTDTRWRPMPKLAPLGLKVANLPLDSEGQSTKVMPVLAPVVAKLAPVGLKTKLPASDLEGQDSKIMPTLASVVTKLNSIGTLPSNSAGK
ncbi:MAX gene-associated protein isoform X8 [Dermochelys coriacea]|uniref:MAX gene-associated protein isoform X8 n=1 Tax=Dermochelys coriacea TaxID=27794 RepID=UPI0018E8929D|nr:MAX gene-associated protein isoform X8 [Dermochelys coriacea]XP_043373564.1 MAX gene-associated protein isoform X8 [Dermochelys coriacea]